MLNWSVGRRGKKTQAPEDRDQLGIEEVDEEEGDPDRERKEEEDERLQRKRPNEIEREASRQQAWNGENQQAGAVNFPTPQFHTLPRLTGEPRDQAREREGVTDLIQPRSVHRGGKSGTNENHCDQWTAITSSRVRHQVASASSSALSRPRSSRWQGKGGRAMIL